VLSMASDLWIIDDVIVLKPINVPFAL